MKRSAEASVAIVARRRDFIGAIFELTFQSTEDEIVSVGG